jgi:hypothetical protein
MRHTSSTSEPTEPPVVQASSRLASRVSWTVVTRRVVAFGESADVEDPIGVEEGFEAELDTLDRIRVTEKLRFVLGHWY